MLTVDDALVHQRAGRLQAAEDIYRHILAQNPDDAEALHWLGVVALQRGQYQAAIHLIGKALERRPEYAAAHNNLGLAWQGQSQLERAITAFRRALALAPQDADLAINLGSALYEQSRLSEAATACEQAIVRAPRSALAHSNLAGVYLAQARCEAAVATLRQAIALEPDPYTHSNLLQAMHYDPRFDTEVLFAEGRRWHKQHAEPLRGERRSRANNPEPERRLRLGYVSADLRRHPVGWFMAPVLEHHDHEAFEVFCYASVRRPDGFTERFRAAADRWCEALALSDAALAERIEADRIDILVDLSGHTRGHRLLTFARKPAPVQVTAGGHYDTTGVDAIDYLIADRFHAPEGAERYFSEALVRMSHDYICYVPPAYAPAVTEAPLRERGHITFGCYNNLAKINAQVAALWAEILRALPASSLRLQTRGLNDAATAAHVKEMFTARGITGERLELVGHAPHEQLLAAYSEIDIALDPFPYSGGLTTCEALWMGVPVITLTGKNFCGRHSTSHLANVGLPELATASAEEYVRLALALAQDPERLSTLRAGLRERMATSPLCAAAGYTRALEAAYRRMWENYCEASGK